MEGIRGVVRVRSSRGHKGEWSGIRHKGSGLGSGVVEGIRGSGQGSGVVEGIRGVVRGVEGIRRSGQGSGVVEGIRGSGQGQE